MSGFDQAFPNTHTHPKETYPGWKGKEGLTKREWFAGLAMQGLLTSTDAADWKAEFPELRKGELPSYEQIQDQVAKCAVEMADALLKRLAE